MPEFSLSWFLCSHCSVISRVGKSRVFSRVLHSLKMKLTIKKTAAVKSPVEKDDLTLLDLPDSILECILERLPSEGLNSMAGVSTALRNMCISDHLWEKHMKQKWGEVIGPAAYRKWLCYIATQKEIAILESKKRKMDFDSFENIWPLFKTRTLEDDNSHRLQGSIPVDSVMAWYLSLETGKSSFPAQVYNRESQNGHVGFMLSCYDAEVFYDCHTNTFTARFHGRLVIEENIEWNRLRKPVIDSPPEFLHTSSCLNDLKPNDHIEIQWRRSKDLPYGWWYGVVGHLESCNSDAAYCQCHKNDTVVLEFTQYSHGSRWHRAVIDRNKHREVGNEVDGFYGGIRKLDSEEEISKWKSLWPNSTLD
ncbi:hypothetical protein LIER_29329 [Lithospermum erythrorhizon]|uniref:F-box domain-containing protein n=1 Tax=Lithospermum erythrorhizon TaxID=34254 RepID=A0AAV3RJT0_LITER